MADDDGVFRSKAYDGMAAFYRHVEDSFLDPHTQYRLESVQIQTADVADDAITAAKIAAGAVGSWRRRRA